MLCCAEFVSLRNLQNALRDLARLRIRVRVRFRPETCKLRVRDFETEQRILPIAHIDKSRETLASMSAFSHNKFFSEAQNIFS